MSWRIVKRDQVTPKDLYELAKAHNLVPRNVASAIPNYQAMAPVSDWYDIFSEKNEVVASCIIAVAAGEAASLDFIPDPRFFADGSYKEPLSQTMGPLLEGLFNGGGGVRRVETRVPVSRGRTKKALKYLGFVHEGRPRQAVHYFNRDPEDCYLLGLLAEDLEEKRDG